jgi:hypothetical protein
VTITDTDRTLAAELGLLLVKLPESADASVSETWAVKVAYDKRPIGRLQFTEAGSLYATKSTTGDSTIEETVAEALRWIAPIARHARTGQHNGVEIVVRRFGSAFERPLAVTECGGKPTGADYNRVAAKSAIINGEASEMCPACKTKLEDKGIHDTSNLSDRSASSTPRQRSFIRQLVDEAARCGRPYLLDLRTLDPMSSRAASALIDALKRLKTRNWKGDL